MGGVGGSVLLRCFAGCRLVRGGVAVSQGLAERCVFYIN